MAKHDQIKLISYLYGETEKTNSIEMWDSRRKRYLPVQSSVFKEYVYDVNRFLFSGGISIQLNELPDEHPGHVFVEKIANKYIHPNLFSFWETLATKGECIAVIRGDRDLTLEFFDRREYEVSLTNGKVTEARIKTLVEIDGKIYVYKFNVDSTFYTEYPLVLEEKESNYDWEKNKTQTPHNYNRCPVQLIGINKTLTSKRGCPEFNWTSINIAASIAKIEYGLDENVYFFGHPLIDSPDPDRTVEDLDNKRQVLQKLPPDEGGEHKLLQPQSLTNEELEWVKIKKESFKRAMGITNTQETRMNDPSGSALRIMADGLISKAQAKWEEIVTYGLEDLIDLCLHIGHDLGLYGLGPLFNKSICHIVRSEPYFAKTDQEKIQSLEVVSRLVELGLDRARALQDQFYQDKTLEEIEELLRHNLEDVL